jgi:Flp pilus assembly protein TadB
MEIQEIEKRIEQLESRNRRVESDKAWEVSWARRLSIALLTYIVVACYLSFVVHINPWINAFVPVIGFTLSTIVLSSLKRRNQRDKVVITIEHNQEVIRLADHIMSKIKV